MFLLRLIFIALVPFVAEIMKKIFLLLLYVMISAGGIIEAQNIIAQFKCTESKIQMYKN